MQAGNCRTTPIAAAQLDVHRSPLPQPCSADVQVLCGDLLVHRPQAEEDDDRHKQLITASHLKALPILI